MSISIKSLDDIKKMRIAGKLASEVLDFVTPFIKPNVTTICIKSFFLFGNFTLKIENNNIGIPNMDGMNDVRELLLLIKLIAIPQIIKNIP